MTHLHGTEILLLEHIDRLSAIARSLGTDLAGMAAARRRLGGRRGSEPGGAAHDRRDALGCWAHGEHWARRLRAAAARSGRIVAISPHLREEARKLLDVPPERLLSIPNGVDVSRFEQLQLPPGERLARWRRWLVEEPQGWDESGTPGTIAYRSEDLRWFEPGPDGRHAPVLLFVGRFTEVKRCRC